MINILFLDWRDCICGMYYSVSLSFMFMNFIQLKVSTRTDVSVRDDGWKNYRWGIV